MAVAASLDVTKKHYTNHSIRKTTVKKLKKAGVSVTEIMAITGHKNQQSLTDYDELDDDDHLRLSRILSSETTTSKQHKDHYQITLFTFHPHLILYNHLTHPYLHQIMSCNLVQFSIFKTPQLSLDLPLPVLSPSSCNKITTAIKPIKEHTSWIQIQIQIVTDILIHITYHAYH